MNPRSAVEKFPMLGNTVGMSVLAYGVTPYFAAFPGSPSLSNETYAIVLRELIASLRGQG